MPYVNVYYDQINGKIHLWELVNGKIEKFIYNHPIEFYMVDKKCNSDMTDIYGSPVRRMTTDNRFKLKELKESGSMLCESDIGEPTKFLQKHYFGQILKPDLSKISIGNIDIEVAVENEFPKAKEAKFPINLITIYNSKTDKFFTFGLGEYTGTDSSVKNYCACDNEFELMAKFMNFYKHCAFQVLTGWNIRFDLIYIHNRLANLGMGDEFSLSPVKSVYLDSHGNIYIGGVTVLDYLELYKEFDKTKHENYQLDTVAKYEIGKGKIGLGGKINHIYKTDWNRFVEYNINDVVLVKEIDQKLKLIELAFNFAYQALIPVDRALSTIAVITGFVLQYLHKINKVLPDKPQFAQQQYPGAYNEAQPGVYRNVGSWDIESMYPHIIMNCCISHENLVKFPPDTNGLIRTPMDGIYFKNNPDAIFPKITTFMFGQRKAFKSKMKFLESLESGMSDEEVMTRFKMDQDEFDAMKVTIQEEGGTVSYYNSQQYIRKIVANSIYGVFGNPHFHLYNIDLATAVTSFGQELIKHLSGGVKRYFKEEFYKDSRFFDSPVEPIEKDVVVLVDTDSCYVCLDDVIKRLGVDISDYKKLVDFFADFDDKLFKQFFKEKIQEFGQHYGFKQEFNFKREKVVPKQIVLAKKRYVAQYVYNEGIYYENPEITYVGIEAIRSTTPFYCRENIKQVISRIFDHSEDSDGKAIIDMLIPIKEQFYKTNIRELSFSIGIKDYEKYKINDTDAVVYAPRCPIHCRAAINYNYTIKKYKLPLIPIINETKIRWIYIKPNNELNTDVIGYIGDYPEEFKSIFQIDYETQWEKAMEKLLQEFFDAVSWGEISFLEDTLDQFLKW